MTEHAFSGVGFNVIGHLSSSSGLGNTARLFIKMLQRRGIAVAGFDFDYCGPNEPPLQVGVPIFKTIRELPYDINLVIVSIPLLPSLWLRRCNHLLHSRFKNAGLIFWELPVVPSAWWPSLAMFDAIVVCSPFVCQAIELAVPTMPLVLAEHPLSDSGSARAAVDVRAELQIPPDAFVCAASFDLRSDFSRKNPLAALRAFQAAFPVDSSVRLLVKTNQRTDGPKTAALEQLLAAMTADPRVVLVEKTLAYEEVLALYSAADVYLSLHRSEGLGLGPMEAMLLGRLAIATGFSGNMAYMTEVNSLPITYRLVEPMHAGWQFSRDFAGKLAQWADPNVEHAARALQWAKENPIQRIKLANRGQRDILEKQKTAWDARYLSTLVGYLETSNRTGLRRKLKRAIQINEVSDPTLRQLNFRALLQKLGAQK